MKSLCSRIWGLDEYIQMAHTVYNYGSDIFTTKAVRTFIITPDLFSACAVSTVLKHDWQEEYKRACALDLILLC